MAEAEAEACSDEAAVLTGKAQAAKRRAMAMKDTIRTYLERTGCRTVKAGVWTLSVCQSQPAVHFDGDPAAIPEPFRAVKVEPNKRAALELWKAGRPMPAGFSVTVGSHLRVK